MTLEQAKQILKTYQMPLTQAQLEEYKQAVQVVAAAAFRVS